MTHISCIQANYKLSKESMVEVNIISPYNRIHHIIPLQWLAVNYNVRRCNLCKFYYATYYESSPKCRLSKHGKPAHPAKDEAEKCCLYLENKLKTHHVILLSGTSIGTTELIKRLSSRIKNPS